MLNQSENMSLNAADLHAIAQMLASTLKPSSSVPPMTLAEFSLRYMSDYARPHKKSCEEDERRLRLFILPRLGEKQLQTISTADVVAMHSGLVATPYQANRVLEQITKMMKLAQQWGFIGEERRLPTQGIKAFPETARDRFVTEEEMERLAAAIATIKSIRTQTLLWLYLLTALRKCELLERKWADLNERELRVGKTKNGHPHYVPLCEEALSLLKGLPRDSEWIFPGDVAGQHLVSFRRQWDHVRERAGLQDVRLHDLRRTVGSWLAQSGVPMGVIGQVMNHRSTKSTEVYARFRRNDARDALAEHGKKMAHFMQA